MPSGSSADWVQVVPWGIALVGLLITHFFSEARERRKELRSQLDKLVERLTSLEELGRKFHSSASYDESAARAINVEISRIERIATRVVSANCLQDAIIAHRQALTLHNFDAGAFEQQPSGSELVSEIELATVDYEEALEREYRERHPDRFPYYRLLPLRDGVGNLLFALIVGAILGAVWTFLATR